MIPPLITTPRARPASPADHSQIEAVLLASHLPIAGLTESLDGFHVAETGTEIVGVVGIEEYSGYGLLRSTAVADAWRGRRLGRRLVECAIATARSRGMTALYLLTTTAERYFSSFGFVPIPRDAVPDPVRRSVEFTSACPASATAMTLGLGPGSHMSAGPRSAP